MREDRSTNPETAVAAMLTRLSSADRAYSIAEFLKGPKDPVKAKEDFETNKAKFEAAKKKLSDALPQLEEDLKTAKKYLKEFEDGGTSQADYAARLERMKKNVRRATRAVKSVKDAVSDLGGDYAWTLALDMKKQAPPRVDIETDDGIEIARALRDAWKKSNPDGTADLSEFVAPVKTIKGAKDLAKKLAEEGGSDFYGDYLDFKSVPLEDLKDESVDTAKDLAAAAADQGQEVPWPAYFKPKAGAGKQGFEDVVEQWLKENPEDDDLNPLTTGLIPNPVLDEEAAKAVFDAYTAAYKKARPGKDPGLTLEDFVATLDEDTAKKRFEAYKKMHPGTEKTVKDFMPGDRGDDKTLIFEPEKDDEGDFWSLLFRLL